MSNVRPSQRLLSSFSPFRSSSIYQIRQWHPRIAQRLQQQPRRHQTTIILPQGYKPRSRRRPYIWATLFLLAGVLGGRTLKNFLNLINDVKKDSEEDRLLTSAIILAADDIPAIQQFLKHEGDPDSEWAEISTAPQEGDVLINETLRGSLGLIVPRAFWNKSQGELWMVVHYGGSLCGWPGIAHGGCTATVLLEGMGRGLNALTGSNQTIRPPEPSHLGLTYLKPVKAGSFYLMKAKLKRTSVASTMMPDSGIGAEKDLAKKVDQEQSGTIASLNTKYDVDCVLESLDGVQCMRAKGVWDVL